MGKVRPCNRLSLIVGASVGCIDGLILLVMFASDQVSGIRHYVELLQDCFGISLSYIWTSVHYPISQWLLGLALTARPVAHDSLLWPEYAYFFLNVVYLGGVAFLISSVGCGLVVWVKKTGSAPAQTGK